MQIKVDCATCKSNTVSLNRLMWCRKHEFEMDPWSDNPACEDWMPSRRDIRIIVAEAKAAKTNPESGVKP